VRAPNLTKQLPCLDLGGSWWQDAVHTDAAVAVGVGLLDSNMPC
jgi:hypothetical protein